VSIHLHRFVERLQGFEARGAKDFTMSMSDAKSMHADLTNLLLELNRLKEAAVSTRKDEVISVNIDGGSF
jgi:hypothetical protein